MSSINILKSSIIVGTSVVALTLSACASSGGSSSRYGNVYDYESGSNNCSGAACGAVVTPPVESRYGSTTVIGGQPVSPGVVYTDCSQVTGMGCAAPVYQQAPSVEYTSPPSMRQTPAMPYSSPPSMSYSGAPVSCPANTTPAGDGTCMMTGSGSYTGSTSWSSSSSSSGWSGSTTSGGTVDCPSNTTRATDGTCMMNSGAAPSVTIYPTTPTHGYVPPVDYTAPVYQPIRK
ncbi:MAG: hypothetical protein L3J65_12560 [Robiginitomaculum sp.]|nr:hypothetical protein [Robiginitomaculum sp.]